jgi:membrane protein
VSIKTIYTKVSKDNVGTLASVVSWSVLTSVVPIIVGLIAISGYFLKGNPSAQHSVVSHLSAALQGVVTPKEMQNLVNATIQHTGLLGLIGLLGVLWGGSNVGGSISTVFQTIFEVKGRNFIVEKLIDIVMIFVFTALMLVILLATAAGALINSLFKSYSVPGPVTFVVGTAISLVAAFLLFAAIYAVFPHVEQRFKLHNTWKGALVAAVIFEIISYIWPLYASYAHFSRDGAILGSLVLLMTWIYFFSIAMLIGAEVVAINSLNQANQQNAEIGPAPDGSAPQHVVLREDPAGRESAEQNQISA